VSADSARKMNYCLEVKRLRKQIDQVHLLDPITDREQNHKVAR
jgi:hypothetical protein